MFSKKDMNEFSKLMSGEDLSKDVFNLKMTKRSSLLETFMKLWFSFGAIGLVLSLAFWCFIVYVVVHFVCKFW